MKVVVNTVKYQHYAALCVNIATVSHGAVCGWPSASFLVLQSEIDTPFEHGPMTNEQASWVGAMLCVGGLVGSLFFSWLAEKIGRKYALLTLAFPALLSWLLIPFATSVNYLMLSRFFGGFAGGGTFSLVPLYVTEITEDCVRGAMGSYLVLSCNIGVLLAFVLGNYLPYKIVPMVLALLPLMFLFGFAFLPETPQHLIKSNKMQEAEKSLRYFRNYRRISQEPPAIFRSEMEKLKTDLWGEEKIGLEKTESSPLSWSDFNNRIAGKAFMIGIALMALNQFCGIFAMINYTASIFQQAGSNLSPNMSAIIVGAIQLLGAYISTMLVERAGRKLLLTMSSIGTGLGLSCLGVYTYLIDSGYDVASVSWVPVASFSFAIFVGSLGVLTLPFLVMSEVMPPKIRNVGCMICMVVLWIFAFFMIKYLPLFMHTFGMYGAMFFFSTCCFAGAIFVAVFVPETKGKSIEAIMQLM